jgi:AGZA family xanthine/uracil permease-like MFS transporter
MLIGAQAFQETPKSHAPAVIIALVPQVAAWGKLQIDNSLGAAGTNAMAVGLDKLGQVGIAYHGLEVLGSGAILVSLILAAITAFMIDREFVKAAGFAMAGAVLTFFGFMHSEAIGVGKTPMVALSYVVVSLGLYACAKYAVATPQPKSVPVEHPHAGSLAT